MTSGSRDEILQVIVQTLVRLRAWRILGGQPGLQPGAAEIVRDVSEFALEALGSVDSPDQAFLSLLVDLYELHDLTPEHASRDLDALRLALTPEDQRASQERGMDRAVNQAVMNALPSMLPPIVRAIRSASDLESARPWLYRLAGIANRAYALSIEKDGPRMTPLLEDLYFHLDYTLDRGGWEEAYADIRAGHPKWGEAA